MDDILEPTTDGTPAQQKPADAPTDWKSQYESTMARYNGLNRTYQNRQNEWQSKEQNFNKLIADLTGTAKDWESKHSAASIQLKEMEAQMAQLAKAKADVDARAATLEKRTQRQSVFMKPEYGHLSRYEAAGLLRTDIEGEELEKYLATFDATLGAEKKGALQTALQGATPAASPGVRSDANVSAEMLAKQLDEAIAKGKGPEDPAFNELFTQWLEAKQR